MKLKILLAAAITVGLQFSCLAQQDKLKPTLTELPVASPSSAQINPDSLAKLIHLINTNPPNDFRAMVVIKDNKLVIEEYFNTYWRETIHDVRSAGKSVTSLLLGIAIDKGLVKSTDQSIYDFFPQNKFTAPAKDHLNIKIKHLLTMSSGLDAGYENSVGNTGNWLTASNWVNFATGLPMVFTPGQKYVYNDVCPMLIGAIIEQASGKKLADFAGENLFTPLGIREYYWYTASNGSTGPMGNLYLSALDFARIGQLVLNKGALNGRQIISSKWISEIAAPRFDINKEDPFADSYGYFWYIGSKTVNGKKIDFINASGNGGNLLIVVPGENMVISLASSAYGQGYGHYRSYNILTAILGSLMP